MQTSAERSRRHRTENPGYNAKAQRLFKYRHPLAHCVFAAKARAKALCLPFNIDYRELKLPESCPCCKRVLSTIVKKNDPNRPSLDRLIPALGYMKQNVIIICYRCNVLKGGGHPEMWKWLLAEVRRRRLC